MRVALLLLILLPIINSIPLNNTGYTQDGVSHVVRFEIETLNTEIDQCIHKTLGYNNYIVVDTNLQESEYMAHDIARCLFLNHHLRSSIRNQFSMIKLIDVLQQLYQEKIETQFDAKKLLSNVTHVYVDILKNILQEVISIRSQLHVFKKSTSADIQYQIRDLIEYFSHESIMFKQASSEFGMEIDQLKDVYTYFVDRFNFIGIQMKEIKDYIQSNNTELNNAITLFKGEVITHYLEVSGLLDTNQLIRNEYDAYACLTPNRSECIYPNPVSGHLESCTMPAPIFGTNNHFLMFNSMIQTVEEAMCDTDTTCIDTQDTSWKPLVDTWTHQLQGITTDRWMCVDFGRLGTSMEATRHLRSSKQEHAKKIAAYLKEQVTSIQDITFDIANSNVKASFDVFGITSIPPFHASSKTITNVFVDDSHISCSVDCTHKVTDVCCMDVHTVHMIYERNDKSFYVQYTNRVKQYDPSRYNTGLTTIQTDIVQPGIQGSGYLSTTESIGLVEVLKILNVTDCTDVASCKKKASNATDCQYNKVYTNACNIGALFKPTDTQPIDTYYTTSDIGTTVAVDTTQPYTPSTSLCTAMFQTTSSNILACKTYIKEEIYYKTSSLLITDFIFGHFHETNKLCTIYKCDKTSFHENGDTNNNGGIILPVTNIQNKTVSIDVLVQGNSNVNPLALACPVDYPDECAACSSGWHHGQSNTYQARDTWSHTNNNMAPNPMQWGKCQENSKRYRYSTNEGITYCIQTESKDCQLVHVTSAVYQKTTNTLTVQWDTTNTPTYPSINFLTLYDGANNIDVSSVSQTTVVSNTPPNIHLYRSDASKQDLGDMIVQVCASHTATYTNPMQSNNIINNVHCTQNTAIERQLFHITADCVVDTTSSYGACQDNNKQYKNLLQIKLPYDGSDAYNGCTDVSQTCYKCSLGQQNKNNDITQTCEDCTEGTYSNTYDAINKLTCQPCASGTYQDQTGQTSCTPITTCFDGHYITQNASSTQNRLCAPCAAGTYAGSQNSYFCQTCGIHQYQPTAGQSSCLTASTCPAGKGVTTAHTTITNTICNDCILNQTFSDSNSYDACESVNHCDPITEAEATAATLTSDVVCGCNSGFIVNNDECQQCPSGSFQTDVAHAKTTCDTWKTCAAGSYISTNGTHKIDRECSPCEAGTYSSSSNAYQCTECATGTYQNNQGQTSCVEDGKCGLGQGMKTEATDESNTVCENCVAGTNYSNTDNAIEQCQAVTVTSCVAGKRFVAATTQSDGQCVDCAEGTYISSETEHTQDTCDAWATCAAGSYVTQQPNSTHNRLCAPCAAGSISTTANAIQCTVCASGTYQDGTGQTSCKTGSTCPIGQGLQTAAQGSTNTVCVNCDGTTTFSDVDSYDACQAMDTCTDTGEAIQTAGNATTDNGCACAAGFYNPEGTACAACSSGTYTTDVNNQAYCTYHTNCTDGSIVSFAGNSTHDRECEACGSGTYSSGTNTEGSGGAYTLQLTDATGNALTSTTIQTVLASNHDSFLLPEDNINYGTCTLGTDNVSSTCTVSSSTNPAYSDNDDIVLAYYALQNDAYVSKVTEFENSNGTPMYIGFTGKISTTFYVKFKNGENIAKFETTGITMLNANTGSKLSSANGYGGHLWAVFQVNPPSGCAAWSTCTAYEYESSAGSSTGDRVCSPLTTCDAGEYVQTAATATSDRECAPCAAGSFSSTENATSCTTWDVCDAGEYITQNASSTQNRLCAPCAAGSFSTGQNAISCTVWDTCDAVTDSSRGEYVTQNASSTQDRLCASCATETYAATVNAYQCVALLPANDACTVNYQCTSANCNNNVCAGQSCTLHTDCGASEYCDSATSACAAKLGTGISCIENEYCQSNNCYDDDNNGAVCAASGGGGGTCTTDDDCSTGETCDAGTCAASGGGGGGGGCSGAGASCSSNDDCCSSACDTEGETATFTCLGD